MDDKTFNATKARVQRILNGLRDGLGLRDVSFILVFERDLPPVDDDGIGPAATIHPNWEYREATIVLYAPVLAMLDDDDLATALLHEIAHYLIHPISRFGQLNHEYDRLEERVCTDLARSIGKAIASAGEQVADRYRLEVKRLERELKQLQKQAATVA